MQKKIVEEHVKKFILEQKPFTSMDISNSIKQTGEWIKNSTVAMLLVELFSESKFPDYEIGMIDVIRAEDKEKVKAKLYYKLGTDPNSYKMTEQSPITPDKFNQINPQQKTKKERKGRSMCKKTVKEHAEKMLSEKKLFTVFDIISSIEKTGKEISKSNVSRMLTLLIRDNELKDCDVSVTKVTNTVDNKKSKEKIYHKVITDFDSTILPKIKIFPIEQEIFDLLVPKDKQPDNIILDKDATLDKDVTLNKDTTLTNDDTKVIENKEQEDKKEDKDQINKFTKSKRDYSKFKFPRFK